MRTNNRKITRRTLLVRSAQAAAFAAVASPFAPLFAAARFRRGIRLVAGQRSAAADLASRSG